MTKSTIKATSIFHCVLWVVVLFRASTALASLPPVSKNYFPPMVPLLEMEFAIKKPRSIKFRGRRSTPIRFRDEHEEISQISNELGDLMLSRFPVGSVWSGGGGGSSSHHIWFPFLGTIVFDSGKMRFSLDLRVKSRTLTDWNALRGPQLQEELVKDLQEKLDEYKKKYAADDDSTTEVFWTKPPAPPVGLCEIIYEIKETGTPPPNGALEIDPEKERQQEEMEFQRKVLLAKFLAKSLWYKLLGKKYEPQCKLVEVTDDEAAPPRKLTPHEILAETARDALDNARPWINAYSGSDRVKVSHDSVHVFSHYGTKNAKSAARAKKIIQRALTKKAAEYPDWFEISFPAGENRSVSFLTMETTEVAS